MDEGTLLLIRKYAIKNAMDYGGKPNKSSIFGKILSKEPDMKSQMKELNGEIDLAINDILGMSPETLEQEYKKYDSEFESEEKVKAEESAKHKFELPGAEKGKVATRFAPEPSGYMHVGHAKAVFLNYELAKAYDGKVFLYFDDTNPENESQEFVNSIKESLDWLGVKFDKEYYASDSIEKLYDYARVLIKAGKAYTCSCSGEEMSKLRAEGKPCIHRTGKPDESLKTFEEMINGKYEEGIVTLRFVGEMESLNTTLRDPVLMRVKKGYHYRQKEKYSVWPLYDFNTPIQDSINGVTDSLRSKEYEIRNELFDQILNSLNLRVPRTHIQARLKVKDNITSKREFRELINQGLISGYSDPRLITISALRRRGVLPEAIKNFVLRFGMSKTDSLVSISMLFDENKKLIDPIAKRLFYVESPVKLKINGFNPAEVKMKLDHSSDAVRDYQVDGNLYISKKDAESVKEGTIVRLKDLSIVKIGIKSGDTIMCDVAEGKTERTIQWVSQENFIGCTVLVPKDPIKDGKFDTKSLAVKPGFVESYAAKIGKGEPIQFERFGFVVLDDAKKMEFIMTSE
jgi:glutamyl-tRNA synthetase